MEIFKFWVPAVLLIMTIIAVAVKGLEMFGDNLTVALIIIPVALFLIYKAFNNIGFLGNDVDKKTKSKKKKKKTEEGETILDMIDSITGYRSVMPFILIIIVLSILISVAG